MRESQVTRGDFGRRHQYQVTAAMRLGSLVIAGALLVGPALARQQGPERFPCPNARLPVAERVRDLLGR